MFNLNRLKKTRKKTDRRRAHFRPADSVYFQIGADTEKRRT